jgi:pyruvate/2-oxoglutarate/acetoin dehydrogenase E1 component
MTTVLASLNQALHRCLAENDLVFLLGEDVLDPYGGAFKVSRGLSSQYPGRVLTTPISEAGIVGVAAGMALRGMRPVVEIMFGDFLTLAADQIINHLAKYRWMYNEQVRVPVIIRTPMGGRRGYGPTHSQTLEKHFLGAPGLQVLAPTTAGNPGALLSSAILDAEDPTLFIENKLQYLEPVLDGENRGEFEIQELGETFSYRLTVNGAPPAVLTLAAYGYMADLARKAMLSLAYEDEIFTELVIPTRLAPLEISPILDSARKTGQLLVIEEGALTLGWGAEVLARLAETDRLHLRNCRRLAGKDTPIPASGPLEDATLPGVTDIQDTVRKMLQP